MDDLISRQDAIDAIGINTWAGQRLLKLPSAQPERKKGKWIDVDALCEKMYHEAFETDSDEQKWDSGCWIRYKMFERIIKSIPVLDFTSKEGDIQHGCTIIQGCGTD